MGLVTKNCGECAMCCFLLEVAAVGKRADQWCRNVIKGKGCAIYEQRPGACRSFRCLWLDNDALDDQWKPSKARFLLRAEGTRLSIDMHPDYPDAWRREPYHSAILQWSRAAWTNEGSVVVLARNSAIAVFPEEELVVEGWEPGATLLCGYAHSGAFMRPMYRLSLADGSVREAMGRQYPLFRG